MNKTLYNQRALHCGHQLFGKTRAIQSNNSTTTINLIILGLQYILFNMYRDCV